MSWRLRPLKFAVLAAALCAASPVLADAFVVNLDEARVLKLPDRVATIIIGNPLIADASLQANGMLVVTGKGYGATNLLALDRQGRVVMDKSLQVSGPGQGDLVTVYKGVNRESYSCAPQCSPRIMLGDSTEFFGGSLAQVGARNGQAASAAPPVPK